jgi:phage shock protein C
MVLIMTGVRVDLGDEPGTFPDAFVAAAGDGGDMTYYDPYPAPPSGPGKRLVRRSSNKMVAGVCGGVADYLGIDANIVRLALVAAVILGFGTGIVLYAVGWWLMPQA